MSVISDNSYWKKEYFMCKAGKFKQKTVGYDKWQSSLSPPPERLPENTFYQFLIALSRKEIFCSTYQHHLSYSCSLPPFKTCIHLAFRLPSPCGSLSLSWDASSQFLLLFLSSFPHILSQNKLDNVLLPHHPGTSKWKYSHIKLQQR